MGQKSLVITMQTQDDITAVEAPEAEPVVTEPAASSPAEDVEAQAKPEKKPDGSQKRINELTALRRSAERRAEELERRLEELQSHKNEAQDSAGKPSLDDYPSYEQFNEALSKWHVKQEYAAIKRAEAEKQAKQSAQKEQDTFRGRVESQVDLGRGEFEDFDDVVLSNPDLPVSQSMAETLLEMEQGHKVAYYLGKNPEEAEDISKMSRAKQTMALVQIEAKLAIKPPAKTVSNAPEPIGSKLNGGASPGKADPSKMSDAEWAKWDAEQQAKKSRR